MPFGLISDDFYDHPKVVDAPDSAVALWARALSYCMRHLTDGMITDRQARRLCDNPDEAIKYLTEVGLWDRADTGYRFHDVADYNPSRAAVLSKRADNAARQQAWRDRKRAAKTAGQEHSSRDDVVTDGVTDRPSNASRSDPSNGERNALHNGVVTAPQYPVPSTQYPKNKEEDQTLFPHPADGGAIEPAKRPTTAARNADDPLFGEFYNAYPRKKEPTDARKAWDKSIKTADPQSIIAGARALATEVAAGRKEIQYTPYPAAWLRAGGWADEPDPPSTAVAQRDAGGPASGLDGKIGRYGSMIEQLRSEGR